MTASRLTDGVREFLLAFADDEHLMGQQHAEWIGVAPFLEEDLAFCSIGQDELGHAASLYALVAGEGDGGQVDDRAIDALAFDPDPTRWRSCHLVEMPTPDWAHALVRHWLYDAAEELRWDLVSKSTLVPLAEAAARATSEEWFHRRHADGLLDVLLVGSESRERLLAALDDLLPVAVGPACPPGPDGSGTASGSTRRAPPPLPRTDAKTAALPSPRFWNGCARCSPSTPQLPGSRPGIDPADTRRPQYGSGP